MAQKNPLAFHLLSSLKYPFVSFRIDLFEFDIRIQIQLLRQLTIKRVFPCYGNLSLFFESLGLDITSLILNPFKNGSNMPFLFVIFFYQRIELSERWILHDLENFYSIEKVLSIPTKDFPLGVETCFIWIPFQFLCQRYTYEVVPTY